MNCAQCKNPVCTSKGKIPPHEDCPMADREFFDKVKEMYHEEENALLYGTNIAKGKRQRGSRMDSTIEFMKTRGFKKIGVAYCSGLTREGRIAEAAFRKAGFETVSVGCKVGGFDFFEIAGRPDDRIFGIEPHAPGSLAEDGKPRRASCDPIGQALLLNREKVEFNVVIGLCVGHDTLFLKYADAPCTILVAKDRLHNHAPCCDLYEREAQGILDEDI